MNRAEQIQSLVNLDVLYAAARSPAERAAVKREALRRFSLIKWETDGGLARSRRPSPKRN